MPACRVRAGRPPLPRALALLLAVASLPVFAAPAPGVAAPDPGAPLPYVVGLHEAYLTPAYWAARLPDADAVILDRARIAAQNARMRAEDDAIHDLRALPAQLPRAQVAAAIQALSAWPGKPVFGQDGQPIAAAQRAQAVANLALAAIPAQRPLRYGLVTHRAALRAFPTRLRVFTTQGDTDIDRFQESALFPGDAVAVLHESADGEWLFVTSERYSAWMEKRFVGIGDAATVLGYGQRGPYRVITGATAFTAYTPEEPRVSRLQLDMGVRLPVLADWPQDKTVNGQQAHAGYVLQLPVREADGQLALVPALLPRSQDSAADYLPLTPRTLLTQAFKFLGERYGWGHDYDTRDCSGFVSEIYRSVGVLMPRNTSAQAVSPALDRIAFDPADPKTRRSTAVTQLQVGDLVYIPGHVMMAIGHVEGRTWVIHDTAGGSWAGPDGTRVQAHLNGVSVTPLEPMMASDTVSYIDRITNIQRLRAKTPE
ncbi:SH3 domain-containing protein [Stenotrophomonas sp.]|uniref:C40 family peptidase n=1 Tax=Stenotrophomonas sp. TaxID=69392 RepID=UPI002FCB1F74